MIDAIATTVRRMKLTEQHIVSVSARSNGLGNGTGNDPKVLLRVHRARKGRVTLCEPCAKLRQSQRACAHVLG